MKSRKLRVDDVLSALADPTRRLLFEATLVTPGLTTTQLCDRAPAMYLHARRQALAVLRDAGLIQTMATGRLRRHYAEKTALGPLRDWMAALDDA